MFDIVIIVLFHLHSIFTFFHFPATNRIKQESDTLNYNVNKSSHDIRFGSEHVKSEVEDYPSDSEREERERNRFASERNTVIQRSNHTNIPDTLGMLM